MSVIQSPDDVDDYCPEGDNLILQQIDCCTVV